MNKNSEKKIILFDDPNLVEYRTNLEGWTGPDGLYYGKGKEGEERARYANSTHKKCHCGEVRKKEWSFCSSCLSKKNEERFLKLEEVEWDGESMMCEWDGDMFFSDMDEIYDYCDCNDVDIKDLKIVLCEKKVNISLVDIDELNDEYCDQNGAGVSHYHPEIAKKVKELNDLIKNAEPKLWFPSNKRVKL